MAKIFGDKYAFNIGFSGDKTQHQLSRIENGELEGVNPKLAILLNGTNNVNSDSVTDIVLGINFIIDSIFAKLSYTTLIIHRIFPRGSRDNPARLITEMSAKKYLLEVCMSMLFT